MKPRIFVSILLFFFIFACKNNNSEKQEPNFFVEGKIKNAPENTYIYLVHRTADNTIVLDSAIIVNSDFKLKGCITENKDFYFIEITNAGYFIHLIAKAGENIRINADFNNIQLYDVENSVDSKLIQKVENNLFEINKKIMEAGNNIALIDSFKNEQIKFSKLFLSENDTSLAAIIALSEKFVTGEPVLPIEDNLQLFKDVDKKLRVHYLELDHYSKFRDFIKNYEIAVQRNKPIDNNTYKPQKLENFKTKTLTGTDFEMKSLYGNLILLNFWAAWCIACSENNKIIANISAKNPNLKIVQISLDNDLGVLNDTLSKYNFKHVLINDENIWGSDLVKLYGVDMLPTNIIIDSKGEIVLYSSNPNDLVRYFK